MRPYSERCHFVILLDNSLTQHLKVFEPLRKTHIRWQIIAILLFVALVWQVGARTTTSGNRDLQAAKADLASLQQRYNESVTERDSIQRELESTKTQKAESDDRMKRLLRDTGSSSQVGTSNIQPTTDSTTIATTSPEVVPPSISATPVASAVVSPATSIEDSNLAEQVYKGQIYDNSAKIIGMTSVISGLLRDSSPMDLAWVTQEEVAFAKFYSTAQEARAITPPAKYRAFHAEYLKAMDDYSYAASEIPKAIRAQDATRETSLGQWLVSGADHMAAATQMLNDM